MCLKMISTYRSIGRALLKLGAALTMIAVVVANGEPLVYGKTKYVPRNFTDDMLPESQRSGELVIGLGRVQLLDTYLSPKMSQDMRTSFGIFNNWNAPKRDLVIMPSCWSSLGRDSELYGPYHFDLDGMLRSGFDASKRTVVMIPGYFSPDEADWVLDARNRWLELDRDVNVIEVSWSDSNQCTYSRAVANTVLVARQVTIFLHYLAELSGTSLRNQKFLNRIHLIGHSLGAHIAGFVGQDLSGQVGRITGLDPAGPSFDQFKASQRLDRNDARLVEVLHTNSGRMKYLNFLASAPLHALSSFSFVKELALGKGNTAWFGIDQQIGHVDYYANNGRQQVGCQDVLHICDHKRARDIYVDLLNYECVLRRSQSAASLVGLLQGGNEAAAAYHNSRLYRMNRLYAFKSPDYETFTSGRSFILSCPELMTISKHLDDDQVLKSFRNCSIPLLDFLRPIDELIEELKTVYGVDFDLPASGSGNAPSAADNSSISTLAPPQQGSSVPPRHGYYFKTSSETGSLVGDHYLLKIYLVDEPTWDPVKCTLEVKIVLNDEEKISLSLNNVVQPQQRILAMPFVHLDRSKAKDQYNNLMQLIKLVEMERENFNASQHYRPSGEFLDYFQELFPQTIMLSIGRLEASGILSAMKNTTIRMIKPSNNQTQPACRLTIDMVEVHPIVYGLKRNFGALYGRDLYLGGGGGDDENDDSEQTLTVLSAADQLKRLDDPNRFVTTLSTESISSFGVGLEAALVG